jgi:hypothetical protein
MSLVTPLLTVPALFASYYGTKYVDAPKKDTELSLLLP